MVSQILLKNPPTQDVNLAWGQAESTFEIKDVSLPTLQKDQLRVKLLYFSNDPTQRNWIGADQDASRTYYEPILKGELVRSLGLAEVLESSSDKYAKGDWVVGLLGWAEELVVDAQQITAKVDRSIPSEMYLSTIGLTGLTAYFGLKKVGQIKEGQTVLVSAASGATGSMVVQLAKHLFKAAKVIGVAGSQEKVDWVKSLGADYCVNYRDADYKSQLHEIIGDDFVDIYYDNVGGDFLDFALGHVKRYGRIVACGSIAGYNDASKSWVKDWFQVISNRLSIQGFIVFDYASEFGPAIEAITGAVKQGNLSTDGYYLSDVSKENSPLSEVPSTWHKLFTSEKPKGKLITKVA